MATQPIEEKGNSNRAEPEADIENVRASVGSASSQSGGAFENTEEEVDGPYYRPLLQDAFKGDWESVTRFFKRDAASKTAKITRRSETLLHIAALSAHDQFLENLVELLSPNPEALEMVDCDGRTALHNAVLSGRIRMVKALVRSNPKLTQFADNEGRVPLGISALEASMHKEIVWFLARSTTNDGPGCPFSSPNAIDIMIDLSGAGHHALRYLTRSFWNATEIVVPMTKRVYGVKLRHVAAIKLAKRSCIAISHMNFTEINDFFRDGDLLFQATCKGVSELVKLCVQFFPELICISPHDKSLTTHAIKFRQERIFRLFLKVSSTNELSLVRAPTMRESNDMMLAVAKYTPSLNLSTNVAGAAFKMQRELQWYKAVEMCIIPVVRTNIVGTETYWEKFVENHRGLLENGEKWVKDTSNSCMLVSTLIATVLFAAAFTVPGGNDNNTGVPLLLGQDSLLVFAISDVLGLFSSVTAILLFLAILTSQYEVEDFLESLPKKIIRGLCFLFLSLAFMLVAFTATLVIVLDKRVQWILIPITLLASLPVVLFVVLQLPLLFQMVKSTYGPSIFRPDNIWDGVKYTENDQWLTNFI